MSLAGHLWTLAPLFRRAPPAPPSRPWTITVEDPVVGPVRLTGAWSEPAEPRGVVVVVHGIGGCAEAAYVRRAAAAALATGFACLRFNLRGADRLGEDYYHAGLTGDLAAALAGPEVARFDRRHLLGFSLGGHVALRLATEPGAEAAGLTAVATVCAPLDLAAGQHALDRPSRAPYRAHVMRGLREIYGAVARRAAPGAPNAPLPLAAARRIRTLREWDERIVAPRHGFAGAADYYARASVAPRLADLRVPALLVAAAADPMVPAATLRPVLASAPPSLEVRWLPRGGHLGFPRRLDWPEEAIGPDETPAASDELVARIIDWLDRQRR